MRLEFPVRLPRVIDGPTTALELLDNEWPARRARHYAAAKELCRAAIARLTSPDAARETFISASIEASVPIR